MTTDQLAAPVAEPTAEEAVAEARARVSRQPVPELRACLDLARAYERAGDPARAVQWAFAAIDAGEDLAGWMAAARVVDRCRSRLPARSRSARVAVLGSYTTSQLAALLPVAAARAGVDVEVYESGYGQYRLDLLDPGSALHAFAPDVVVLAVDEGEVHLPPHSDDPAAAVAQELARWTGLWDLVEQRLGARVVQHTFAVPPEESLGNFAARVPGARRTMLHRLDERLAEAAGDRVGLVDCEWLSGVAGKEAWFDARYRHLAKQAVGLGCVPRLARHTAAVLAAQLGLSRKVLVLDLDGTLWGGVLGEVGLHGITLGAGPAGEAYSDFQRYVLELRQRGVVLAVSSKNDEPDVREVFTRHPDMLVRLEDVAVLLAGWGDKPSALRRIAATLGVGLDSLVFVDDNPAERAAVQELLPEVDVVPLPVDPAGYVRALARYPFFEPAALTAEDAARTAQYRARAQAAEEQAAAGSLEEFLAGLGMCATVDVLGPANLPRVAQLVGKTNQFNLTARRHPPDALAAMATDPCTVSQVVRLRDRFADHGVVGVLLATHRDDVLTVHTWLLSCRVIGRTLEDEMFAELVGTAARRGCRRVVGLYTPTARNGQVAELYARLGFTRTGRDDGTGTTVWELGLPAHPVRPGHVAVEARPAVPVVELDAAAPR
ncbi:HAD-IIIC family phosphatase [Modestobacter versicolor]|uniref:HAD-IIIC family phosphatase n=1 Tax=Modestobacter versicolor TaxID=429133 RepID=UPI0034DEFDBE